LPIAYFEARRVGDSVARVRELENIRNFLTSSAVTLVIDVLFSVVFIALMLFYSPVLTLVVFLTLPLYVVVIATLVPPLRRRLEEKFNRGAENQALLVESISGVATIKSLAAEPQLTRRWDQALAAYVAAAFNVVKLHTVGSQAIGLINKLATVAILWFGARLVIEGELTVGMLVAFNMLAARVAMPVMHIAQLWQDFQQTGISIRRLGDILNARTEVNPSAASLPPIKGRIEFDRVRLATAPTPPKPCAKSASRSNPAKCWGWSAPAAPAKAAWPSSCSASTSPSAAGC
jgi:subfamily B ATP-binding cassette protein HlyB/CyaB